MTPHVIHADSRNALRDLAAASVDAVVTDPPYGLVFMGKQWDTGEVAFDPAFWAEVLRVMKPGAHLVAFGGTRTFHRLVCAIEDAGFEVRDQLAWLFGSGFPKSRNLDGEWQGWGTALKPAHEPICLARKPLIGTVAANVLAHGTGALNIDASRIAIDPSADDPRLGGRGTWSSEKMAKNVYEGGYAGERVGSSPLGRWPANVIHDGSPEVLAGFPETDAGAIPARRGADKDRTAFGAFAGQAVVANAGKTDAGSAARFFYTAKADADDRLGSKHPTVKPVDLMAYLVRLITPPGGVVLDPFAGSGTTGMACMREGFHSILIEREAEYVADIKRRIAHVRGEDAPLFGAQP